MGAPRIPGAEQRRRLAIQRAFLLHRLGQLETAYRDTLVRVLELLDPSSDAAARVRRVLQLLEG